MKVESFFDEATFTFSYVVYDPESFDGVIIDPVLDYDPASGKVSKDSAQKLVEFVSGKGIDVKLILETHAHADHLSSALYLKEVYPGAKVGIGATITLVQETFCKVFNACDYIKTDGSQFDMLFEDGQKVSAGTLEFEVIYTPGHTPACASYLFGDKLFTGDSIFMPDFGTGRCDFPLGSAEVLYDSIQKRIYSLPDDTEIYVGHDYMPNGRELANRTTVGQQKKSNIHVRESTTKEEFVEMRNARDAQLSAPKLLYPSVQVNVNAGQLPPTEENGTSYIKIPVSL